MSTGLAKRGGILFQHKGWWFPDGETHLVDQLDHPNNKEAEGRGSYQYNKLLHAMKYCDQFRTAIDVGAHVGLWSWHLAKKFERVEAFEPIEGHILCFLRNVLQGNDVSVRIQDFALGDCAKTVRLKTGPISSGDTKVDPNGDSRPVSQRTLDSFGFENVDFIKIDCEGYEPLVLMGAEKTIRDNEPCIIVEQRPGFGVPYGFEDRAAVKILESWGAVMRKEIVGDFIMSWD